MKPIILCGDVQPIICTRALFCTLLLPIWGKSWCAKRIVVGEELGAVVNFLFERI